MARLPNARTATLAARLAVGAALLVAAGALAACSGGDAGGDAATPTTTVGGVTGSGAPEVPAVTVPPGFVLRDTRGVAVAPFVGRQGAGSLDADVYGGAALVAGAVNGPEGPLPGATVQLERFEGERIGVITLATGADGRFRAEGVHGGRYRVRAWLQPSMATTRSEVVFLPEDGAAEVVVAVERYQEAKVDGSVDAASWEVGGAVTVRAVLTRQAVDASGIVVTAPVPAAEVRLDLGAGASLAAGGTNPARTDGAGAVSWRVECTREGPGEARFASQVANGAVNLPSCSPRSATGPTTTLAGGSLPVGGQFQVPFAGPVPAGTYRASRAGCVTLYEELDDGDWDDGRSSGAVLRLDGPGRSFQAGPGTQGCGYERLA